MHKLWSEYESFRFIPNLAAERVSTLPFCRGVFVLVWPHDICVQRWSFSFWNKLKLDLTAKLISLSYAINKLHFHQPAARVARWPSWPNFDALNLFSSPLITIGYNRPSAAGRDQSEEPVFSTVPLSWFPTRLSLSPRLTYFFVLPSPHTYPVLHAAFARPVTQNCAIRAAVSFLIMFAKCYSPLYRPARERITITPLLLVSHG